MQGLQQPAGATRPTRQRKNIDQPNKRELESHHSKSSRSLRKHILINSGKGGAVCDFTGCYLFTGLFSWSRSAISAVIAGILFLLMVVIFDLWPWAWNFVYLVLRWASTPQKFVSRHTETQHTQLIALSGPIALSVSDVISHTPAWDWESETVRILFTRVLFISVFMPPTSRLNLAFLEHCYATLPSVAKTRT